jgi:hypothetical protein
MPASAAALPHTLFSKVELDCAEVDANIKYNKRVRLLMAFILNAQKKHGRSKGVEYHPLLTKLSLVGVEVTHIFCGKLCVNIGKNAFNTPLIKVFNQNG